jgi:hypothetical protein
MSSEDIYYHLYTAKDMPWGQAMLALWAMYPQSLAAKFGSQTNASLKEDIGWFDDHNWTRPT